MIGSKTIRPGAPFTQQDIDIELQRRNLQVRQPELDRACRNLSAAGILDPTESQFRFRVPIFARMLEEQYPTDYVFEKAARSFWKRPACEPSADMTTHPKAHIRATSPLALIGGTEEVREIELRCLRASAARLSDRRIIKRPR